MAKEVFDQARPKSTKAQLFADAFAGCDEWVVPPRKPRQSTQALYDVSSYQAQCNGWDTRKAA